MIQGVPYDAEIEYLSCPATDTNVNVYDAIGPYINTDIYQFAKISCRVALNRVDSNTYYYWFKAGTGVTPSTRAMLYYEVSASRFIFDNGNGGNTQKTGIGPHTFEDVSVTNPDASTPLVIFANTTSNASYLRPGDSWTYFTRGGGMRLYWLKIWDSSNALVADFIPVRVGTGENAVGYMYDRVSGKLFGNMGTGAFVLGQDIAIPVKSIRFRGEKKYDAEVEYLESDGTTYVDTGLSMPVDGTMDYEFMMLDRVVNHANYQPFGRTTPELTFRCADSYGSSTNAYTQFGVQGKWLTKGVTRFAWHSFTVTPTHMLVDEASSTAHNGITSSTNTIWCGKCRGSNASVLPTRFRLFQIKDSNGVITHQMKPVRVGNNGYLYDKITDQLVGSGNLKVGPDVVQSKFWLPMPGKIIRGGATARDYIQDGLVAMWDGIENAGFGRHDPNATVWVDLAGGRDINLLSSLWGDAYADMSGTYGLAASTIPAESVITMESVAMFADSRGLSDTFRAIYVLPSPAATNSGVTRTVRGLCWDRNAATDVTRSNGWMIRSRGSTYDASTYGNVARIVAIYDGIDTVNIRATKMYVNSVAASLTNNGASHNPAGVRVGTQDAFFSGRFYACRIYNRALTAAEIAHNHAIDVERFGVPS